MIQQGFLQQSESSRDKQAWACRSLRTAASLYAASSLLDIFAAARLRGILSYVGINSVLYGITMVEETLMFFWSALSITHGVLS